MGGDSQQERRLLTYIHSQVHTCSKLNTYLGRYLGILCTDQGLRLTPPEGIKHIRREKEGGREIDLMKKLRRTSGVQEQATTNNDQHRERKVEATILPQTTNTKKQTTVGIYGPVLNQSSTMTRTYVRSISHLSPGTE